MRRLGTGLAIATLATLVAAGGAEPRTQRVELQRTIYSAAVKGQLRLAVYLPEGYATNGARSARC